MHPVFEYFFNTPQHHRVHHSSNRHLLDKNYGGVLIIFDRLLGTFAEASDEEELSYGLVDKDPKTRVVDIALGETITMLKESLATRNPWHKFMYLVGPPGWSPENEVEANLSPPNSNRIDF